MYYLKSILIILLAISPNWANCQSHPFLESFHIQLEQIENRKERINFILSTIEANTDITILRALLEYLDEENNEAYLVEKAKEEYWRIRLGLKGEPADADLALFNNKMGSALNLIKQQKDDKAWEARIIALQAEIAYRMGSLDKAQYLDSLALASLTAQQLNPILKQGLLGDLYRIKANIFFVQQEYDSVFHYYHKAELAYKHAEKRNGEELTLIAFNKGIISSLYSGLGHPDSFYNEALNYYPNHKPNKRANVFLEWGISLAKYALNNDQPALNYSSNEKLYKADQLRQYKDTIALDDTIKVARLYYQLGANYQNLAKFIYDETSPEFQEALDSSFLYYKKSVSAAVAENDETTLNKVYYTTAQVCRFLSNRECESMISSLQNAYQDNFNVKEQIRYEKNSLANKLILQQHKAKTVKIRLYIVILVIFLLLGLASIYALRQKLEVQNQKYEAQKQKIKAQNQKIEAQQQQFEASKKILESKLKALRAQMNPHFISNSLNAIDSLVIQKKNDLASKYLVDFCNLCRMILDSSREPLTPLEKEIQMLKYFLSLEQLRLPKRLNIAWDIDQSLNLEGYLVPALILQPFAENAIWHGILNKENRAPGLLSISIKGEGDRINCILEDDGVGRKKAKEIRSESLYEWQSWGMQITNERIEALNQIEDSQFRIIDLYDSDGFGIGTKVIISLPIISNNNEREQYQSDYRRR